MIPKTSRVSDIAHLLANPSYVSNVIGNFVSHGYDLTTARVRIGVMGGGLAPNYKIEEPSFQWALQIRSIMASFTVTPASIFNGRFHHEMVAMEDLERRDEHWSSKTMSLAELQQLSAALMVSDALH